MAGNGAIAALVAITAPSGYVELWAAPIIGAVAGVIVVARRVRDRQVASTTRWARCRRTAWPASGARSPAASSPRRALAEYNARRRRAASSTRGSFHQLGAQALGVVVGVRVRVRPLATRTFWVIKKTYGMRVTAEEEDAGLDISEHGMYGYPEQFIPAPELVGYGAGPAGRSPAPPPDTPAHARRCRS